MGYQKKTEKLVREDDGKPSKLNEALLTRLIHEQRCIIFYVLTANGNMIPMRVRSDKTIMIDDAGQLMISGWLPDCKGGFGKGTDRCVVHFNPDSTKRISVEGQSYIEMGSIEFNLEEIPQFVLPALPRV